MLFLLYINNLHKAMIPCSVQHGLKHLCQWIQSNRLSLNGGKTKTIIFRNRFQQINKKLNFRVSGEKINPTSSVKYLEVHVTHTLAWNTYLLELIPKLNRAVRLLSTIRHYTPKPLLWTIYYSPFNSHMIYLCQTWGQSKTGLFNKIEKLQDKARRIINFLPNTALVSEMYKTPKNSKTLWLYLISKCFTSEKLFWKPITPTSTEFF